MKTTIEINGRIYDAKTGKIVSSPSHTATPNGAAAKPVHRATATPLQRGVVMDGVSRKPAHQATVRRLAQPHTQAPAVHPPAQKSQTLHRKAVKKPGDGAPAPFIHSTSANMESRVEQSATGRGMLLKRVPDVRLSRALSSHKSNLVSKFGRTSVEKPKLTADLTVKAAPVAHKPASRQSSAATIAPAAPVTAPPIPAPHKHPESKKFVFEDHIKKANSHLLKPVKKEPRRKKLLRALKVSPKVLSATAAVFAVLLLGGFFAYQNVPTVSMRVAASTAGFEGKLPKSIPAGYAFNGPVNAAPDNISITYKSNSDNRKFIVTQKPTNWSSEGLLTNYLLDSQFRYQAYKDKGLTIYIYNGSNATWVDKGVWFSVNGEDGSLSSEQLLELASSI